MFADRVEAGRKLAEALLRYKGRQVLVLALPRGGVPVGFEIARTLDCSLDTIVARKVGAPGNPEYAVGAIAPGSSGGEIIRVLDGSAYGVEAATLEETKEMKRRQAQYKSGSYAESEKPDVVILVDDGVATGQTATAALRSARLRYPKGRLVFAAPVGAPESVGRIEREADEVVVLEAPPDFVAVGQWYRDFPQLEDREVIRLLESAGETKKS